MYVSFHFRVCTCTYFDLARQTGFALRPPACITYMSSILIRWAACKGGERPDLYSSQEKCSLSRLVEAFFIFFVGGVFNSDVCMYVHTYLLIITIVFTADWFKSLFFFLLFNLDKGDDDVRVSERHGNCEGLLSALYICTLGKGKEVDPRIHI